MKSLNMRKIIASVIAFAVAGTISCSGAVNNYKVTGTKAPKDGATVHLIDRLSGSSINSTVVSKGSFEMKGKADKDAFLTVKVDGVEWDFLFFNDGKPVKISVADKTVSGSALNSRLSEWAVRNAAEYDKYYSFIESFMSLSGEEQEAGMEEFMPQYQARIKAYGEFYLDMIEKNKDSLIPVAFIEHFPSVISAANEWDKAKGDRVFNELLASGSPCAKHPYVLDFKRRMDAADAQRREAGAKRREAAAQAQSLVGRKFLDLEELDRDGKPHKLSEYVGKGRWVLVDFWAAWCNPCKVEMPNVVAAYRKYHDKGFDIVGLSLDNDRDEWIRAIREWDMPWIHLSDLKYWQSVAIQTYSVTGIPDNLLIDPEGTIVARGLRGAQLEAVLSRIFE